MPSFLNKVFGYKRHDDNKEAARPTREASDSSLLDGKYEAIAPVLSPSASTFAEAQQIKDADRDTGFSLFRPRARGVHQKPAQKHSEDVPHLTLQLPPPRDNRALGIVFEADPDSQIVLDDAVIAAKRLNSQEALSLIKACIQAITERGLETLGIMHPHWSSASPDVQRRLISLFIRSLTQTTTLPPSPTSSVSTFENELHFTRSPHDVAAVLRWGLRHLSFENGHFGKDGTEWGWYNTFSQAERNASYPLKGFSELLAPQLPASHIKLLTTTLSMISSLASRAEANGISGSKLSKFLGLWLLVATRAEESDDWNQFYGRWERSGRILEHLFLARLREESSQQRLPTRLQELIKHYPYNKGSPAMDGGLLPRPRFSTRQYDALFVRVDSLLARSGEQPKQHPIQLLLDAFQLPVDNPSENEHTALWNTLKSAAFEDATSSDPERLQFTRIFVDETIHLLSLIPVDNNLPTSPTLLTSPINTVVSRKPPSPLAKAPERALSQSGANNGATPLSPPLSPTSPSSIAVTDWAQFTLSGFGDAPASQPLVARLSQDDDVEVTQPQVSRKSSRHRGKSRTRRQRSEDREPLDTPSFQPDAQPSILETKLASVHVVQIDEAFIDFWSDAVVDPLSASLPTFVVCGLKQIPSAQIPIRWLVIEQAYSHREPSRVPSPDGRRGRSPRPSFKSDISGFRINSVFSSARKRFSMFSKSVSDLDLRKSGGKTPIAGELGEVLVEEEPTFSSASLTNAGLHVDGNATVRTAVTSGVTAGVPDHLKAGEISIAPIVGVPPAPVSKDESDPNQVVVKAPSIESTPQSRGGYDGSSLLPRPSVRASEETISAERDSPRDFDFVNPKDTTSDLQATSGPAPSVETPVAKKVQIRGESNVQQGDTVEAEVRPVKVAARTVDRDVRLHTRATGEPSNMVQLDVADSGSRKDTIAVVMPSTPETVALVATTPAVPPVVVDVDEAPEPAVEEPHAAKQLLQKTSADPVAALTIESVGGHAIDGLSPLSSSEIIATEMAAQLEPHSITSVVDEDAQEVSGHAEIPTPAPELVTLVEETPGQEAPIDVCGHPGDPAAQPEIHDGAAAQLVMLDDAASQPVAAELQATLQAEASLISHPVEAPLVEDIDASVQVVAAETGPAADQVPELPTKGTQDSAVRTAEAPFVEALATPEINVSAAIASTSQVQDVVPTEVKAQAAPASFDHEDIGTQGGGTVSPLLEHAALDGTPGPLNAAGIETTPGITPEFQDVGAKTRDPVAEASPVMYSSLSGEAQPSLGSEPPTQVDNVQCAVEALSTGSNLEVATAVLATPDEIGAVRAEAQPALGARTQVEAHPPVPESALVEDAPEFTAAPSTAIRAPELVAEEVQVLVDAAPIASETVAIVAIVPIEEPVARDAHALTVTGERSSASVPQSVHEATLIGAVSVPEEIHVEVPLDPGVPSAAIDTVDEPTVQDAKLVTVALEHCISVEDTQVLVDANEPEAFTVEPELAGVNVPVPVVGDALDTEALSPLAVGVSEGGAASQPGINEKTEGDEPQTEVNFTEPMAFESRPSTHAPGAF